MVHEMTNFDQLEEFDKMVRSMDLDRAITFATLIFTY